MPRTRKNVRAKLERRSRSRNGFTDWLNRAAAWPRVDAGAHREGS